MSLPEQRRQTRVGDMVAPLDYGALVYDTGDESFRSEVVEKINELVAAQALLEGKFDLFAAFVRAAGR